MMKNTNGIKRIIFFQKELIVRDIISQINSAREELKAECYCDIYYLNNDYI